MDRAPKGQAQPMKYVLPRDSPRGSRPLDPEHPRG